MSGSGSDRAEPDLTLVRRCLAGDEDAWRRLIDAHRQRMIDLARRVLPSVAAADVVDGAIADLWERRKLERFEGRSTLATWLGAVAINAALNARRAASGQKARMIPAEGVADVPAPTSAQDEHAPLAEILADAITALPAESKLLVLMYYEQQLTLDQAAALLLRSKSTLSRMLTRARELIVAEAERLSRERLHVGLAALRAGADLSQLDLDLRAACARSRDRLEPCVSKS